MCGIAGYYRKQVSQDTIEKVLQALHHRGPDDRGVLLHQQVGLIHTRLSIIDLSKLGAQPYQYQNLVLTYNGEIYNYKEVRHTLVQKGYQFVSNSDSEVLIKAFHHWREKCVNHFVGMFAFAIYEKDSDVMWLFRDRLGVKPLYYSALSDGVAFASELKALQLLDRQHAIDPSAIHEYFRFGFIGSDRSVFERIRKVKPGTFVKITGTSLSEHRYWEIPVDIDASKSEEYWIEELEAVMTSAFAYRMVSDVPVGIFLSGGLDSSLLTAILKKSHGNISTYTIGFEEQDFDEARYARAVAGKLGVNALEKTLRIAEARSVLNDFYSIYDEPFADTSGIPTSCIAKFAREHGTKVVLSADGGDELFGGYPHYRRMHTLDKRLQGLPVAGRKLLAQIAGVFPKIAKREFAWQNLTHRFSKFQELLLSDSDVRMYEAFIANQSNEEINRLTGYSITSNQDIDHQSLPILQQMMLWDARHFLPDDLLVKVDRATMFHGVECREPFLDHRLVELAFRIPLQYRISKGEDKRIIRNLISRYLPRDLFNRRKQGFSIPIFQWFKQELDVQFEEHLSLESLREIEFINENEVMAERKKYLYYKSKNKQYNIEKMWRILSLVLWWKKHKSNG
ncbi:MAG: asparagine synthase (glutamine-hydrolyzing) [Cyclobacteriaceae bacterium]